MEIVITRNIFSPVSTISSVKVDGVKVCYVLEDCVRPGGEKVFGKTAIPAGRYRVIINRSTRFSNLAGHDVFLPLLENVPGYAGVRIHKGNAPQDTEGCLLPGMTVGKDFVGHSAEAFQHLFDLISAAIARGEQVWLSIS